MRQKMLLAAALAALPIAAIAQTGLSPEQIVAARQAAYQLSAADFVQMKMTADAGGDVHRLALPARAMASWARTLPSLFPAGTNLPSSKALPTVWSERAGFEARAAAYAAAATSLAEAAQAGDLALFRTRLGAVRQACADCHDHFRAPD